MARTVMRFWRNAMAVSFWSIHPPGDRLAEGESEATNREWDASW